MPTTIAIDELLAAAQAVDITLEGFPSEPIDVQGTLSPVRLRPVIERYARHGFAIMQLDPERASPDALTALANGLGLGEPFAPPLYGRTESAVSRIAAATASKNDDDSFHPAFEGTGGLDLHCDGTLQEIGYVKSSMLLCQLPAAEGGHTTLFNAAAAYAQLVSVDRDAAVALATPGAIVRQANLNGSDEMNVGPAFTVQAGRLVCGYSVSSTDRWGLPYGIAEGDLQRGVGFLMHASLPGSQHFAQLTLGAGQAILFDNTRLSHGRTPYYDPPGGGRCLYRSLHLRHPSVREL